MRLIVEQLDQGSPLPIARLIDAVAGQLDEEMVRVLVGMLVKQGLVEIRA
jgi:hypothetical protein